MHVQPLDALPLWILFAAMMLVLGFTFGLPASRWQASYDRPSTPTHDTNLYLGLPT